MGIPAEVPTDGLNPVVTPTAPTGAITAGQFQGLLKCPGIGDVRQKTVVATVLDVPWTAIVGGHHRQTTGRGLQKGESEGFGQRRVHKQPPTTRRPAIKGRNLGTAVLFGIGHLAIEIKAIHQIEHLLEHIALLLLELTRVIPTAQHKHQVVTLPQHRRLTKGFHQSGNVLAPHRTGNRQQGRTIRLPQKRLQQALQRGAFLR